jgi:hypothetical protein
MIRIESARQYVRVLVFLLIQRICSIRAAKRGNGKELRLLRENAMPTVAAVKTVSSHIVKKKMKTETDHTI